MIHDQIAGYVREDKVAEVLPKIGAIMENLPYRKGLCVGSAFNS
jgi:hypothetical protein